MNLKLLVDHEELAAATQGETHVAVIDATADTISRQTRAWGRVAIDRAIYTVTDPGVYGTSSDWVFSPINALDDLVESFLDDVLYITTNREERS